MNVIKLNTLELPVTSYNKNTSFNGDSISSNAYLNVETDNVAALNELAEDTIDVIQILHEDSVIYDLQDAGAKISSINESMGEDRMYISVNLIFEWEMYC